MMYIANYLKIATDVYKKKETEHDNPNDNEFCKEFNEHIKK